jgi:hypothetical protein
LQGIKNYFNLTPPLVDHEAAYQAQKEASAEPWAAFEIAGFEADGRIKVKFNWNQSFIKKIKGIGFEAETDEDTVQLFFYTSSMRPTNLASDPEDDAIQSDSHPQLSKIQNELRV